MSLTVKQLNEIVLSRMVLYMGLSKQGSSSRQKWRESINRADRVKIIGFTKKMLMKAYW